MVDVSTKPATERMARASGFIAIAPEVIEALRAQALPKGDVLTVAQVAGIQAAKRTAQLIPLCHPLSLTHIDVRCDGSSRSESLGNTLQRCQSQFRLQRAVPMA